MMGGNYEVRIELSKWSDNEDIACSSKVDSETTKGRRFPDIEGKRELTPTRSLLVLSSLHFKCSCVGRWGALYIPDPRVHTFKVHDYI